jgi:hypothetical protein
VHDCVDAVHGRVEPITGLHVPHDVPNVSGLLGAPPATENADLLPRRGQAVDNDAAHGSRAAGYEYRVRHTL